MWVQTDGTTRLNLLVVCMPLFRRLYLPKAVDTPVVDRLVNILHRPDDPGLPVQAGVCCVHTDTLGSEHRHEMHTVVGYTDMRC